MPSKKSPKGFMNFEVGPKFTKPTKKPEKEMSAAYKMHGGKVHYKPGGGMVADDMNKVMQMMHGGKVHDAKYYKKGAKVAGCGPARNNPMKKKA